MNFEKQNSLEGKDEDLKPSSTCTDNLLVLKRIGEIKEAPEYQAKKKHDAQIRMRKMREFRKMQNKKMYVSKVTQFKKIAPKSTNIKVIKEYTQSELPSNKILPKFGNEALVQNSQQSAGQNELLPEITVETIKQRNIVHKIPQLRPDHSSSLKDQKRQKHFQVSEKVNSIQINKAQSLSQSGNKLISEMIQGHIHVSQQSQGRKLHVLSAAELESMQQKQKMIVGGSTQSQVRKVRVLSQSEVEKMQKIPKAQIKNIRVYSKDQLNKTQENLHFLLINDEMGVESSGKKLDSIQPQQTLLYQSLTKNGAQKIQNSKMNEKNQHTKTMDNNEILGIQTQKSLNDNVILSADIIDTHSEKQNISEKFTEMSKVMNDTIGYVDQVMKSLDKTSQKIVSFINSRYDIVQC